MMMIVKIHTGQLFSHGVKGGTSQKHLNNNEHQTLMVPMTFRNNFPPIGN